jgi:large subunit ribosomal protein L27
MAHKKGAGSSRNGRDSQSKRLGVKLFGGQAAKAGNHCTPEGTRLIGSQCSTWKRPYSFALTDGEIEFKKKKDDKIFVSVKPVTE